jgi:hypothetical protein
MAAHRAQLLLSLVGLPYAGCFALFTPTRTPLRRVQPRPAAVAAPQMLALPSFGSGGKGYDGPSEETQNAFRMLGVSEDATYDEITESYEELCTKYKGETKRLIRLQAAKDIVLEDRLRQRMAGTFKSEISQFNMDIGDNRKVAKLSLQDRLPNWMTDYVELPTKKLTLRNIVLFGFFSMLGVLSTTWVKGSIGLGFAFGFFLLYNRGLAADNTSIDEMQQQRTYKKGPVGKAILVNLILAAFGAILSQILPLAFLAEEAVVAVGLNLGFFTSATFFKVQDEDGAWY